MGDGKQQEPGTHESVEGSIVSQNLTEEIEEKEKLVNFLKARYQDSKEDECLELLFNASNELIRAEDREKWKLWIL